MQFAVEPVNLLRVHVGMSSWMRAVASDCRTPPVRPDLLLFSLFCYRARRLHYSMDLCPNKPDHVQLDVYY